MLFQDRHDAGRRLAETLPAYKGRKDVVVLALPRGGVAVGYEVAVALGAPLDVFVVRKLGVPGHAELAMGAIATGGVVVLNTGVVRALGITETLVEQVAEREERELSRRERLYRSERPAEPIAGRTAILVDDGLATGASMRAAAQAVRRQAPARLVIAAPVAAAETCDELRAAADEVVCAETPEPFYAVGLWYRDFTQTSDDEVRSLLEQARHAREQLAA
jgi:putative phosphoribosyl transferase